MFAAFYVSKAKGEEKETFSWKEGAIKPRRRTARRKSRLWRNKATKGGSGIGSHQHVCSTRAGLFVFCSLIASI